MHFLLTSKLFSNIGLRYKQIVENVEHLTTWSVFPACCRYGITINTKKKKLLNHLVPWMDAGWWTWSRTTPLFLSLFTLPSCGRLHAFPLDINQEQAWIHGDPDTFLHLIILYALIVLLDISYRHFTRMTRHQILMN